MENYFPKENDFPPIRKIISFLRKEEVDPLHLTHDIVSQNLGAKFDFNGLG